MSRFQQDPNTLDDGQTDGNEEVQHQNGEVSERLKALEQNQALLKLMSDPDIQAVIRAKQSGKPVEVKERTQEETQNQTTKEEEVSLTEGLEENDPMRSTLSKIEKLLDSKVRGFTAQLDQRLQGVEHLATEVQKKEVIQQVNTARQKYKDFDEYREKMLELSKTNPGLGVDELYVLSKHRSGKLRMAEQATHSERPTSQPRRGTGTPANRPNVRPPGRKGFSQILGEALGSLNLDEVED